MMFMNAGSPLVVFKPKLCKGAKDFNGVKRDTAE